MSWRKPDSYNWTPESNAGYPPKLSKIPSGFLLKIILWTVIGAVERNHNSLRGPGVSFVDAVGLSNREHIFSSLSALIACLSLK